MSKERKIIRYQMHEYITFTTEDNKTELQPEEFTIIFSASMTNYVNHAFNLFSLIKPCLESGAISSCQFVEPKLIQRRVDYDNEAKLLPEIGKNPNYFFNSERCMNPDILKLLLSRHGISTPIRSLDFKKIEKETTQYLNTHAVDWYEERMYGYQILISVSAHYDLKKIGELCCKINSYCINCEFEFGMSEGVSISENLSIKKKDISMNAFRSVVLALKADCTKTLSDAEISGNLKEYSHKTMEFL